MRPPAEQVHWLFATGLLLLGLCLLARAAVGVDVWDRRPWRRYLWPALAFAMGLLMWAVTVFFTNSTMHVLAHGLWAEVMTLAGAAHLGLASGKLRNPLWQLTMPLAFALGGAAFLVHEQNDWLASRSAFVHHAAGWTLIVGAVFPLLHTFHPRKALVSAGYAATLLVLALVLFTSRNSAPVFAARLPTPPLAR